MQNRFGFVLHEHKNVEKKCLYEDRDGLLIPGSGSTGSSGGHLSSLSSLSHWHFPPGFWVLSSLVCIISFEDLRSVAIKSVMHRVLQMPSGHKGTGDFSSAINYNLSF